MTKERLDAEYPRVHEIPFTAERKMKTTIHKNLNNNKLEAYIKGACEVILGRRIKILVDSKSFAMSDEMKDGIMAANDEMAKKGLRGLALAYRQ